MKDNSGNIKQYTAEDIRRYVQEEMSPMEMHAIERAALEDPFLADAIDGYASSATEHGMAAIEKSRNDLQREFAERLKKDRKRKAIPIVKMKWWQAAAAAVIIVTAGVLGYRSYTDRAGELLLSVNEANNNTQKDSFGPGSTATRTSSQVAIPLDTNQQAGTVAVPDVNKQTVKEKSPSKTDASAKSNSADKTSSTDLTGIAAKTNTTDEARSPGKPAPKEIKDYSRPGQLNDQELARNEENAKTTDLAEARTRRDAAASIPTTKASEVELKKKEVASMPYDSAMPRQHVEAEKQLSGKVAGIAFENKNAAGNSQAPVNYFNGQILTPDNKPLSNAVLKLNNNPTTYTTDNNGKFRIASPDSVIEVEAFMAGRETTRFRLQKDEDVNNLVLPDVASDLHEVVVIGYGKQRKKNLTGAVTVMRNEAMPEGGWQAWENYLQTNKDSTLSLNGSAETELSFQVSAKNKLSQFRVIKSISSKHDQEVIRLIKEGPQWNLLKGKKATVTITVKF